MNINYKREEDLEKRMEASGLFIDMTYENFEKKIKEFLDSETSEQTAKDIETIERIKRRAENNQLKRELTRYNKFSNDTRVLSAVAEFMDAPMEERDTKLNKVIRVLNNTKDEYDKIRLAKKYKG